MLASVLRFEFKKSQNFDPKAPDFDRILSDQTNKEFSIQFLTQLMVKSFGGDEKIDLKNYANLPMEEKNRLKMAGIAKEDLNQVEPIDTGSDNFSQLNRELFKTLFEVFKIDFRLLALKKANESDNLT